jgi:hypothetical protein
MTWKGAQLTHELKGNLLLGYERKFPRYYKQNMYWFLSLCWAGHGNPAVQGMNCLRSRRRRDRGFETHSGHRCLVFVLRVRFFLCLCTGRDLATSWSPAQGFLPTLLDLVTDVTRKVSWKRPRPELGCRAKGKKKKASALVVVK